MPTPQPLSHNASDIRKAIMDWYIAKRRKLPWREQPSLYGTVVSEFMLQQTQIRTALPYYERWLRELPSFEALAACSEERVLKLWEGLGYYTRARNLHKLAKALIALPEIPKDRASWLKLPGIGPYTSAAITSIAFGTPAACVDGNVVRILSRLTNDETLHRDSASASKTLSPLAEWLLNPENPGDHNQAMMELGATVCTKHKPQCNPEHCPVHAFCLAASHGSPSELPRFIPKQSEKREITRIWSLTEAGLLLQRRPATAKRLAKLIELPEPALLGLTDDALKGAPCLLSRNRSITRYRIREDILEIALQSCPAHPDLLRVPLKELDGLTFSGPHRRWIDEILESLQLRAKQSAQTKLLEGMKAISPQFPSQL